ncbi:DUF4255 domain-containing protein [Lutimonas halocynthiae]|uniref:DUF4255 domain-containing protein n=1 Tax=Lutimonas halocynthiae TaxID=1446477 RepID=UPI0025B38EC1|nr:DUF4255 domain-containing protein [Lutimonas halocynthiae]MDN3643606.1 DUF4255 domain-containing protein [Lutimonas halocynthiae]
MIAKALIFLTTFLNKQLNNSYDLMNNPVMASSLINPDGSITENIGNKIVISVINMEHETYMNPNEVYKRGTGSTLGQVTPPIYLNIYLMISANYNSDNYLEAFKNLSAVISVLQSNPYFTKKKHPEMADPLTKLTMEIFNVPLTELSHIWSGIGAKYVPSLVYKMRMITIQEDKVTREIPMITGLETKFRSE